MSAHANNANSHNKGSFGSRSLILLSGIKLLEMWFPSQIDRNMYNFYLIDKAVMLLECNIAIFGCWNVILPYLVS